MEKKAKKSLTASQKQRRYRVIEKVTYYSEFASIGTPYVIMGAINFDEWFKTDAGWKVGLGGSIAIALMSLAVLSIKNKKVDTKFHGYVKMLLTWLAVAFMFILLREIMDQIAKIMLFGATGIAGAIGLDFVSVKYGDKADLYRDAIKEVQGDDAKEEARKEAREEAENEKQKRKEEKRNQKIQESRRRATE